MKNKTLVLLSAVLAAIVVLFHLTAKKQPSDDENAAINSLNQPLKWQGKTAPDFSVDFLNGGEFVLSDHIGKKAIILNFFATWCGPCKQETPEFVKYFEKHKEEPFLMIGIDSDEPESAVRDFVRDYGMTYPVAIDRGGKLQRLFSVRAFPTTVFIGADAKVHIYEVGGIMNADIAFDPLLTAHTGMIKAGTGITKEAYLALGPQAMKETQASPEENGPDDEPALTGRGKVIAEKMHCPCGCDHTLTECTCNTAKEIRKQLRTRDFANQSDEEVIKSLNREFCMK